ncbi:hypothetical protein [Roseivirga sp.]|uniref:hypothetical protein n=1 Tax=Roseivirga sp. TaxID=1964215 RepID=UPI003B52DE57
MSEFWNYLQNATGIDRAVLAPILITILVFFCGELFKFLGRAIRKWKRRSNYRKIFMELSSSISSDILKQSNGFKQLYETLNIENQEGFVMSHATIAHLDNFLSIPFSDFYDAFFVGRLKKSLELSQFNKVYKHIRSISEIQNDLSSKIDLTQESYLKYKAKWDENVSNFTFFLEKVIHNPDMQNVHPDQCVRLDKIYKNYQGTSDRFNPNVIVETLVKPIQNYLKQNGPTPFSLDMLRLANDTIYSRDNLNAVLEAHAHEFGVYKDVYDAAYRFLSSLQT